MALQHAGRSGSKKGSRHLQRTGCWATHVYQWPSHTRRPQSGRTSSPVLSFTNPHFGINTRWEPIVSLNSDHLPIIIDLDGWFSSPPNFLDPPVTPITGKQFGPVSSERRSVPLAVNNLPPPPPPHQLMLERRSSVDSSWKLQEGIFHKAR